MKRNKYLTLGLLFGVTLLLSALVAGVLRGKSAAPEIAGQDTQAASSIIPDTAAGQASSPQNPPAGVSDNPETTTCTYPIEYWQARAEAWPPQVVISGQMYRRDDVSAFYLLEDPDEHSYLMQQVYTAFLNVLNGAKIQPIESTLEEALAWLEANPREGSLSEFTRRQGRYIASVLAYYNNGEIGPGACQFEEGALAALPPTPTTEPSATASPTIPALPTSPPQVVQQSSQQEPASPPPAPTDPPPPTEPPPTEPPPPTSPPPTAPPPTAPPPTEPPPPTAPPPTAPPPTAPPPTEPPPAQAEAPKETSCPDSDQPQGRRLAEDYDVSYEEIMGWFCAGFGFGEIDKAYELSRESNTPVADIFEMRRSGMGWGEIKKKL